MSSTLSRYECFFLYFYLQFRLTDLPIYLYTNSIDVHLLWFYNIFWYLIKVISIQFDVFQIFSDNSHAFRNINFLTVTWDKFPKITLLFITKYKSLKRDLKFFIVSNLIKIQNFSLHLHNSYFISLSKVVWLHTVLWFSSLFIAIYFICWWIIQLQTQMDYLAIVVLFLLLGLDLSSMLSPVK